MPSACLKPRAAGSAYHQMAAVGKQTVLGTRKVWVCVCVGGTAFRVRISKVRAEGTSNPCWSLLMREAEVGSLAGCPMGELEIGI